MNRRIGRIILAVIVALFIFGGTIITLYTDWLWFGELGYTQVFRTQLATRVALGVIAGLLFFAIVYANLWLARRFAPPVLPRFDERDIRAHMGQFARRGIGLLILGATLVVSVLVALEAQSNWFSLQMFTHPTAFGEADPVFHRDIGFYIFQFGFLKYIYGWLFFTLVVTFIASAAVHYLDRAIDVLAGRPTFAPHVKAHLSFILAALLFVKAWGYRLNMYELLYSPAGVVFGAGYTDVHARMIALSILSVVAVIAGVLALANIYRRGIALPTASLVILIAASFIIGVIYPAIVQQVYVKPNEIVRESRYIRNNIDFTRKAFNLDKISVKNFPAADALSPADLEKNRATLNSIRLWDYRPLDKTYSQLQELGPYYRIANVDVDRYVIGGELRQVTLAARELTLADIQSGTSTWVNRHFQYTHGYGAVMSPVNRATEEGLPDFFVKDIPPRSSVGIGIKRPQIYFGEMTDEYVVVNSRSREFDYPAEGTPVYTRYAGKGGIPIAGYGRRLAFAWRFSDLNMILSNPISTDSRLMFRRNIRERVQAVFPYLQYDPDPYLVISGGKLYWMLDAYTVSSRYPYSTPLEIGNYMRNAAKVVVDAYDGTVNFYAADETDPILATYRKVFPGVFKPLSAMPEDLRAHIRYPEMLFRAQSAMLLNYHVKDPQVLYNKSDRWDIPFEIVGTSEEQTQMEPYYVVMTLPGEAREEFLLMLPFTPTNKNNMIAWMAAKSGPEDYGKLTLYQFPRNELVQGPANIESRIRQDSSISPQLSLWDQRGSRVNWGNLLVIPIENSVLYVKPLYLESETSKIPELKRVVVAYGGRVVMEETLPAALSRIFGGAAPEEERRPVQGPTAAPSGASQRLIDQANREFRQAEEAQRKGDWAAYGEHIRRLGETLRRLRQGG
ncbi:MAG: UPF0182 family membrane protein [Armatimonadota bacterium]